MIDAHCHLDSFRNLDDTIKEAKGRLDAIVTCGYSIETSKKSVDIAKQYADYVFPVVGVAPQTAMSMQSKDWDIEIPDTAVAIGEIGLDFHWGKSEEEKKLQYECFGYFLDIAEQCSLPVVIHSRNSHDEVLGVLAERRLKAVVLHCFSGKLEHAQIAHQRGYVLSFPPIPSKARKEAANLPDVRLIVESDAPYIGKSPLDTVNSAELIAQAQGKGIEEVDRDTTENAKRVFSLDL